MFSLIFQFILERIHKWDEGWWFPRNSCTIPLVPWLKNDRAFVTFAYCRKGEVRYLLQETQLTDQPPTFSCGPISLKMALNQMLNCLKKRNGWPLVPVLTMRSTFFRSMDLPWWLIELLPATIVYYYGGTVELSLSLLWLIFRIVMNIVMLTQRYLRTVSLDWSFGPWTEQIVAAQP